MSKNKYPTTVTQQDYDAIQSAVMETERGRWFLNEYAQRNRVADTEMLLGAIKKLEEVVAEKTTAPAPALDIDTEKMRFDIVDMANAIAETKQQIASIKSDEDDNCRMNSATAELDAIVIAAETATSDILSAAENIQEVSWSMREDGPSDDNFDKLDELTTNIYMACSFQDITGQRTTKVIEVLQFLENRVAAMMDIWGIEGISLDPIEDDHDTRPDSHLLNGPQLEGDGVEQNDIDMMLTDENKLFDASPEAVEAVEAGTDDFVTEQEVNGSFTQEIPDEACSTEVEARTVADDLPADISVEDLYVDTESDDLEEDDIDWAVGNNQQEQTEIDPVGEENPEELVSVSGEELDCLSQTDKIALFT